MPSTTSGPSPASPAIAVAVVSFNTRELLDACLHSMRPYVNAGLAEVWVVDNGSTDGSREMVAERHPWARLLELDDNPGYGAAANRVAERTGSPWVAPSNADVELLPGSLEALLAAGDADPGTGLLGPRLLLPDGSTQPSIQRFPGPRAALREALRRGESFDYGRPARVPWVTGAFFLVRREAWDAVGGFDEAQWMYAEDLDLCWRLARAGWATRYEPRAEVRHALSAATVEAFGADVDQRWRRATVAWMVRRNGVLATWATAGVQFAFAAGRAAVLAVLARHDAARFATRRARARAEARSARLGLRGRQAMLGRR